MAASCVLLVIIGLSFLHYASTASPPLKISMINDQCKLVYERYEIYVRKSSSTRKNDFTLRRKKKCIRYKQIEGDRGGGSVGGGGFPSHRGGEENGEEGDDSMLRTDRSTLDASGFSDSDVGQANSPRHLPMSGKAYKQEMDGDSQLEMGSPLSPIVDEEDEEEDDDEVSHNKTNGSIIRDPHPSSFLSPAGSPSIPAPSSPRQPAQPPRHFTPHTIDSFLFSTPPSLRLPHPYPIHPPSPLAAALPMPYLGFPRLPYPLPHSPHAPHTPTGSPFNLDLKPII